jgi:predicted PurR-regulated permease PerM
MSRFLRLVAAIALAIDFCYTVVYWLIGLRPHRFRRYCGLLGMLSTEAALIYLLMRRKR